MSVREDNLKKIFDKIKGILSSDLETRINSLLEKESDLRIIEILENASQFDDLITEANREGNEILSIILTILASKIQK